MFLSHIDVALSPSFPLSLKTPLSEDFLKRGRIKALGNGDV